MNINDDGGFAGAIACARGYWAAASLGDKAALRDNLAAVWRLRTIAGGMIATRTRQEVLSGAAMLDSPGTELAPTSAQVFFGDFAVVRGDDWRAGRSSIVFVFKSDGVWRIAGEARVGGDAASAKGPFRAKTAEAEVLNVLDVYYCAVEDGRSAPLADIFHPDWRMTNHEGGAVVSEDRTQFLRRIDAGPTRGYNKDRGIADVQVLFDSLACVRIDKPSTPGVTVFLLAKVSGTWVVVDKAWSMAR